MSEPAKPAELGDGEHLQVLGYEDTFNRSMSLWANFALGFTYLSPLVGVYSLFALALTVGGPPSIWWIVIVGAGQLLVSLVFGEVVSQYPIHGGIYPWARRLVGPALRLDGGLGLHLGDDRHDHRRRRVRLGLRGQPVRRRAHRRHDPLAHPRPPGDRPRHQPHRHEVARPRRAHRPRGRAHRRHRPRALPADLPAPAGLRHLLRHHGRRGRRELPHGLPRRGPRRPVPASTASRPAATSPRRSRTRRGASPRR